jgi:uncharacterized delta-60 repeat protein
MTPWYQAAALQGDGKIVMAGDVGHRFAVMRITADGQLDRTFSGDGRRTVAFGSGDTYATDVAVQADGKLVLAGQVGRSAQTAVARLMPDGRLDRSFAGDGRRLFASVYGIEPRIALAPDGKIVAVGSTDQDGLVVARFTREGLLDRSFARVGAVAARLGAEPDAAVVAVGPDGRVVVAYSSWDRSVPGRDAGEGFYLLRFGVDGARERDFTLPAGVPRAPGDLIKADAILLQADGSYVVCAERYAADNRRGLLARFQGK